jgi:RND family efflux transporter MFP subunit
LPALEIPRIESAQTKPAEGEDSAGFRGTGTLFPREKAELGPKMTGVITKLTVAEGDTVKKGQLLFTVDAGQASLAVQQAQASLNAANINQGAAELDFNRTKELFDRGSVPPATFDQVKARLDGARTQVEQAKVAVSQAQKAVADTAVVSPLDGVVSAKLKSVGELATLMPPTIVLVVEDVRTLELRARLPERALSSLKSGDKLQITVPATGEQRDLQIERINPTVDPRARTIEVVSRIDNQDGKLRPGMLAEVRFADPGKVAPTPAAAGSPGTP